jgi:hypothetical protein
MEQIENFNRILKSGHQHSLMAKSLLNFIIFEAKFQTSQKSMETGSLCFCRTLADKPIDVIKQVFQNSRSTSNVDFTNEPNTTLGRPIFFVQPTVQTNKPKNSKKATKLKRFIKDNFAKRFIFIPSYSANRRMAKTKSALVLLKNLLLLKQLPDLGGGCHATLSSWERPQITSIHENFLK